MKKNILKTILVFLLFVLVIFISYQYIFLKYANKRSLEKSIDFLEDTENFPFFIDKIILYSSAYGNNRNTNFQQTNWILNLYQYTDIAIYLKGNKNTLTPNNTIKKLSINSFHFYQSPTIGEPTLYYLDVNDFGTGNFSENNKIENTLTFNVLNDANTENLISTNTPVLFSDLSNPITLKYVNPLYSNFELPSHEIIHFDGNLLNRANIKLQNLSASFRFNIEVVNYLNETFLYNLNIDIPLENNETTIFSGKILECKEHLNYPFIKIQP